jgi:hypothetical protein
MQHEDDDVNRRDADRVPGKGWQAQIQGIDTRVTIVNISRRGIAIETSQPLALNEPYLLDLTGPAGKDRVGFYLVRCEPFATSSGEPCFICAGLFVQKLKRKDLPKVVHEDPE